MLPRRCARARLPRRNAPSAVCTCAPAASQCSLGGVHVRACRVAMLPRRCARARQPCRNASSLVCTGTPARVATLHRRCARARPPPRHAASPACSVSCAALWTAVARPPLWEGWWMVTAPKRVMLAACARGLPSHLPPKAVARSLPHSKASRISPASRARTKALLAVLPLDFLSRRTHAYATRPKDRC
jgi:hypothetical protein